MFARVPVRRASQPMSVTGERELSTAKIFAGPSTERCEVKTLASLWRALGLVEYADSFFYPSATIVASEQEPWPYTRFPRWPP